MHLQPTPGNRATGARLLETSADLAGKDRKGTDAFPWRCAAAGCMHVKKKQLGTFNDCQLVSRRKCNKKLGQEEIKQDWVDGVHQAELRMHLLRQTGKLAELRNEAFATRVFTGCCCFLSLSSVHCSGLHGCETIRHFP